MTATKLTGFTAKTVTALEAAGWIKGTECGYAHHTGFVHGTQGGSHTTYSLTPTRKNGVFLLAVIRNGICERKNAMGLADVLSYFG